MCVDDMHAALVKMAACTAEALEVVRGAFAGDLVAALAGLTATVPASQYNTELTVRNFPCSKSQGS